MATKTITAKLTRKAGTNNKGFQLEGEDGWFNATEKSAEYLAKIKEGTIVEVSYTEKGGKRTVLVIKEAKVKEIAKTETKQEKKLCPICKEKELKGDYPTCWDCRDKVEKKEPQPEAEESKKKTNYYDNSEKTAHIQRGNALNAAASVMSNPSLNIPDTSEEGLIQVTIKTAERFLDWLREE